ncbi:uncharacterized protein LOC144915514 [Branchiostoma floridae x Branchiostoma belcheri]
MGVYAILEHSERHTVFRNTSCETCSGDHQPKMTFLNNVLFLCVLVTGQLEYTLATINECVGPPPVYNKSKFEKCVGNQAIGSCNCTVPAQTCHHGDQLYYTCDHGSGLDFIIICNYEDVLGERLGFIIWRNSSDKFEACTGSPAPVQSTPAPQPTFPPSNCSSFNVASWPPEGCIRLVGSERKPHETTGILQVYFNTTWGSVCETGIWTDSVVVGIACRMLGFSHGSLAPPAAIYHLPPGLSNDAWEVNIQKGHSCSDTEGTLWNCDRTEPCWLTHFIGGSGECPNLLKISCEVNTTFSNLTSCPRPITTTPNPTSVPDISTQVPESFIDPDPSSSSGHESSPSAGLSTAAVIGIVAAVVGCGVLALLGWAVCGRNERRSSRGGRGNAATHPTTPPGQPGTPTHADNNQPTAEPHHSMPDTGEGQTESHNDDSAGGNSGARTDPPNPPPGKTAPQMTPIDS